jgi:glycosyltransferase involved in cell wall biosynthesis
MKAPLKYRTAYLVSKYPDVSHTFILREVLALRERGVEIEVASINCGPTLDKLTVPERREVAATFYIKQEGFGGALHGFFWACKRAPAGLFRGLAFALKLSRGEPTSALLHLAYFAEALILGRWMAVRKLRHVHVHFATPAATVALILARVTDITFSITVHGPDEFYDVNKYSLVEKLTGAKFAVAISHFAQSQMMKLTSAEVWPRFEISRLGVDTSRFAPRPFREKATPFRVLCVGRLVSAKGQRILIDAVSKLRAAGRDVELTFVGDGPDRKALEFRVERLHLRDAVHFMGSVNQDHIRSLYEQADVFALASFAEGIPVVLMEAMAMEIPCISTRIAGIAELIESGVDGLLVAPSDVDGLATAIATLMDDPMLRERLGKAGRVRVQREYELDTSVERLAELLCRRLGAEA